MTQERLAALRPTRVGLQILAWSALWKGLEAGVATLLGAGGFAGAGLVDLDGAGVLLVAGGGAIGGAVLRVVLNYVGAKAAAA